MISRLLDKFSDRLYALLKTVSEGEKLMGESAEDVKREEEIVKVSDQHFHLSQKSKIIQ